MKHPKGRHILGRFLDLVHRDLEPDESKLVNNVAKVISDETIEVWKLYFGEYVIIVKKSELDRTENESADIIERRDHIESKFMQIYQ